MNFHLFRKLVIISLKIFHLAFQKYKTNISMISYLIWLIGFEAVLPQSNQRMRPYLARIFCFKHFLTRFLAFVDLEKAFDRVPRKVLWWALRKVGVDEWLVQVVKAMYNNASSRVRVNGAYSEPVDIKVGVHQGSVLSPLLFLIVLEALSREFRTGCPWELLYADDLVLIDEDLDRLIERLGTWKRNLEAHGLRVNMGKTKGMVTGQDLEMLRDSGKYPCGFCRQGVGVNSIFVGAATTGFITDPALALGVA